MVKDIEIYEKVNIRRATRVIEECKGKDYRERLRVDGLITYIGKKVTGRFVGCLQDTDGGGLNFEGIEEGSLFTRYVSSARGPTMKL